MVVTRRSDLFDISNQVMFEALRTDIKVGLTFAMVASEAAEGSAKRTRNQTNARNAYDAVLRSYGKSHFTKAEMKELA